MSERLQTLESLTAEERIELIGRLWNSLDPAAAAPLTPPSLPISIVAREKPTPIWTPAFLGPTSATSFGPGFGRWPTSASGRERAPR